MTAKVRKILMGWVVLAAASMAQDAREGVGPPAEDLDWPRMLSMPDNQRLVIHEPQLESWKGFSALDLRAAITVESTDAQGQPAELIGSMRMRLQTAVDLPRRKVLVSSPEVLALDVQGLDEKQSKAVSARLLLYVNAGSPEVQLDDLLSGLDPSQLAGREVEIDTTPPRLIISDEAALLVAFDGEPQVAPIAGTDLALAMNTPSLLFQQTKTGWWYMMGWGTWIKTSDLKKGVWVPAPTLPSTFQKLPDGKLWAGVKKNIPGKKIERADMPKVYVAFEPTELLITFGTPSFQPIEGTTLSYVDNTESDLFLNSKDGMYYLLTSGRWYRTRGAKDALEFCTDKLPAGFAKIPLDHPAGRVLASVPGTAEANAAVLANSLPRVATVKRGSIEFKPVFRGRPKFVAIEGSDLSYAVNTGVDVFRVGDRMYACSDGLWFETDSERGPWKLCDSLPGAVATIPATSPFFSVTFVRIDRRTDDSVTYAYTPGYFGNYANRGVVVWGTGRTAKWPAEFWLASWDSRDYWLSRWRRDELHQWHRHLTFGQGRWYDHEAGLFRMDFQSVSHAKFRSHRAQAYRTWNGTAVLAAEKREAPPKPETEPKTKVTAVVAKDRANLYTGADGKVYKYAHGVWLRQDGAKWTSLSRRPELKGDREKREKLRKSREARARSFGTSKRYRRYRRGRGRRVRIVSGGGWGYYGGFVDGAIAGGWGGAGWGGGGCGGLGLGGW